MLAEYVLIVVPFIANAIVIYLSLEPTAHKESILIYSIASSAFAVFGYAINPQRHKKCYRNAYSVLDNEINLYLSNFDSTAGNKALTEAIKAGERFIDSTCDIEK